MFFCYKVSFTGSYVHDVRVFVVTVEFLDTAVLAIVTAVVDASGAGGLVSPAATLTAYRPALILITAVAAVGAEQEGERSLSSADLPHLRVWRTPALRPSS